jgi:hypothetical protein
MRRKGRGLCLDPLTVAVLAVLLLCTTWCIPYLGVSCADLNSSRIGAIASSTNNDSSSCNSSSSSSSSTGLLLHHRSRLLSGRHNSLLQATFHASTVERWGILLMNATNPSKATHCEVQHPWSISRGANRGVLHHRPATPTTSSWMGSPREKC